MADDNNNSSSNQDQLTAGKVERYVGYALQHLSIGLAEDGQPYAYLTDETNWIAQSLTGQSVKRWLRKEARSRGEIIKSDDLNDILDNLYAHAAIDDTRLQIHLRVGRDNAGNPELDLGTQDLMRIRFQNGIAHVVEQGSKTLFSRPGSMLPLPIPAEEGDWRVVLPYLNMAEDQKLLFVAWMSFSICHERGALPYPVLVLHGQQGSGKSFLCSRILRPLIDDNAAGIQLFPNKVKDLAVSSRHQYVLIYDNVRGFSKRQSDDLCVMATGGSISARKLWTDDDQALIKLHSPVVLNGIHSFVQEPDLASRCLTIHLLTLDTNNRREEADITRDLERELPNIFRGLLDLCAQALHIESSVEVIDAERMMSFCRWLAALEQVMGLPQGNLQKAYSDNLRDAALETVQDNALASTLLRFATSLSEGHWVGTPSALLAQLNLAAPPQTIHRHAEWPQSPISLSKRLKQVAPLLNPQGIELAFAHGTQRQIEVSYTPPQSGHSIDGTEELDENGPISVQTGDLANCAPTTITDETYKL